MNNEDEQLKMNNEAVLMKTKPTLVFALLAVASLALAAALGCSPKKYSLQGEVVAKDAAGNQITVNHGDIPGFMSAMAMPYRVKDPAVLSEVEPGDKITATVVIGSDRSDYWLEDVRIVDKSGRGQFHAPPGSKMLAPGTSVPGVALVNQDGRKIHLTDFSGKAFSGEASSGKASSGQAVLVTFIYTRCPMPDFCPRLSTEFARIHNELKKNKDDYDNTHLVTVSFDPKYDKPAVLRKYGLNYLEGDASGFAHWDFATGTPDDLHQLAEAFGLQFAGEDNAIVHNMVVVLISPQGTVDRYWGREWTTDELKENLLRAAHNGAQAK